MSVGAPLITLKHDNWRIEFRDEPNPHATFNGPRVDVWYGVDWIGQWKWENNALGESVSKGPRAERVKHMPDVLQQRLRTFHQLGARGYAEGKSNG